MQTDAKTPRETSLKHVLTAVGGFDKATEKIFPRITCLARVWTTFKCLSSSRKTEISDKRGRKYLFEKFYGARMNLQPNSGQNFEACDFKAESLFLVKKCITKSKHFRIFGTAIQVLNFYLIVVDKRKINFLRKKYICLLISSRRTKANRL